MGGARGHRASDARRGARRARARPPQVQVRDRRREHLGRQPGGSTPQAQYYLDNTTLTAPEDGRIINLQVRPGMVSGTIRVGGIAALIADADRYLLATYYQQNLKYVRPGQRVEVALHLYPGRSYRQGRQYLAGERRRTILPSDDIPKFLPPPPNAAQGQYAVKILLDVRTRRSFPSARKARPRSTPAGNAAPGRCCARSRCAAIHGRTGSTR